MAYIPKHCTKPLRSPLQVGALSVLLTLASSARETYADTPAAAAPTAEAPVAKTAPDRPTYRLEYHLLDARSRAVCPTADIVRAMFNRFFGYEAIDDNAGAGFALDVASSNNPPHFEVMSHLLRDDNDPILTTDEYQSSTSFTACFHIVFRSAAVLYWQVPIHANELKAPPNPEPEPNPEALAKVPALRPAPPPALAPPLTPSITVTLPPLAPAPAWRRPQGFMLTAGLTTTIGLTPTPSLGGVAGLSFRRGDWSGALEARLDNALVPADIQKFSVDSLYAGAALLAPCVHEGVFSGCLVLEGGGYSFSLPKESFHLTGHFSMLGIGLRANLEHRVGEHFLLRGFVQVSAMPITPSIDLPDSMFHLWNSGPAFGTLGLTFISLP